MQHRNALIITIVIALIALIVLAAFAPDTNSSAFVSPLALRSPLEPPPDFTPSHWQYAPAVVRNYCCPTVTPTLRPTP